MVILPQVVQASCDTSYFRFRLETEQVHLHQIDPITVAPLRLPEERTSSASILAFGLIIGGQRPGKRPPFIAV